MVRLTLLGWACLFFAGMFAAKGYPIPAFVFLVIACALFIFVNYMEPQ